MATHEALRKNFGSSLRVRNDPELVTGGPYRAMRPPLCTGVVIPYAVADLLAVNWAVGICGLSFALFIVRWRMPAEERRPLAAFGAEHRDYRLRTGRVLSRPRRRGERRALRSLSIADWGSP